MRILLFRLKERLIFVALAVCFAPALAAPMADRVPEAVVNEWFSELRSQGADVKVGAIDTDRNAKIVHLNNVKVTFVTDGAREGLVVTIGRIDVKGATSADAGRITAEQVRAERIAFSYGSLNGSIKSLQADGFSIQSVHLGLKNPARPFYSSLLLLKESLSSEIRLVTATEMTWTADTKNAVGRVELKNLRNGKIESIEFDNVESRSIDDAQMTKLDRLVFENLNPALMINELDMSASATTTKHQNWSVLADKVTAMAIESRSKSSHAKISIADFGVVRLRSFSIEQALHFEAALDNVANFRDRPEETRKIAESIADSVMLEHITLQSIFTDDGQSPPVRLTSVERIDMRDLAPLNAGSIVIINAQARQEGSGLRVDRLNFENVQLIPAPVTKGISDGRIPYAGGISIEGVNFVRQGGMLELAKLHINAPEHVGPLPTKLVAQIQGLKLSNDFVVDPGLRSILDGLGLKALALDANLAGGWDESLEQVDLDQLKVSLEDIGTLELSGSLIGIPRTAIERPEAFTTSASSPALKRLHFKFTDLGFMTRLMSQMAAVNKQPPDRIRTALTSNMPVILGEVSDASTRNNLIFALISFINDPQSLDISMTALAPVPIAKVVTAWKDAPTSVPALLKVTAAAKRKQ